MSAERPSWRQHLRALADSHPGLHPYSLAIQLEVDGYRNITGKQVADELRQWQHRTPSTPPPYSLKT